MASVPRHPEIHHPDATDGGLVGSDAHRPIVLRFGLPAALAAVGGPALLVLFTSLPPWAAMSWLGGDHQNGATRVVRGGIRLDQPL